MKEEVRAAQTEEAELKKEIQSLKKIKDKLFLEIQRIKMPIKAS